MNELALFAGAGGGRMKTYVVLKKLYGIPAGSILEKRGRELFYKNHLKFSESVVREMPGVFQEIKP